jgi:uncharacterized membrane protein YuzA (DUF378 family)
MEYQASALSFLGAAAPPNSKGARMRALNTVTLILLIVGGLNWGLVGLANFDLVAAIFGEMSPLSRIVYLLVGLSALWQIVPLVAAPKTLATR